MHEHGASRRLFEYGTLCSDLRFLYFSPYLTFLTLLHFCHPHSYFSPFHIFLTFTHTSHPSSFFLTFTHTFHPSTYFSPLLILLTLPHISHLHSYFSPFLIFLTLTHTSVYGTTSTFANLRLSTSSFLRHVQLFYTPAPCLFIFLHHRSQHFMPTP